MTTLAPPASRPAPPGADVPPATAGRLRRWWAGWRLALRMARRDVVRDRGRSGFVWLMIVIPIAAFAGSQVILASQDISAAEHLDLRLGSAHTRLTYKGVPFTPDLDPLRHAVAPSDLGSTPEEGLAPTLPVWGETTAEREAALAVHTGQSALGLRLGTSRTGIAGDGDSIVVLDLDASRAAAAGMVTLTSGRFPAAAGEVLVTPAGEALGLPESGTVDVRPDQHTPATWQVVGTADLRFDQTVYLISWPESITGEPGFLLFGENAITWADAEAFAKLGFETTSRGIAANPPSGHPELAPSTNLYYGGLFGAGALLQVALLVGPAFAIGANRQRRSLALAACNGASVRQLRRTAVGQAVLLGATATVTGTVGGTLLGIALWPAFSADPSSFHGPLDIPLPFLDVILLLGVLTALIAALIPTRGLGRLDVAAALRGSTRSATPTRGSGRLRAILGAVCVAAGTALTWLSVMAGETRTNGSFLAWVAAVVLAATGVLLLTPHPAPWPRQARRSRISQLATRVARPGAVTAAAPPPSSQRSWAAR
jgi:putative ABC transport system permease protein